MVVVALEAGVSILKVVLGKTRGSTKRRRFLMSNVLVINDTRPARHRGRISMPISRMWSPHFLVWIAIGRASLLSSNMVWIVLHNRRVWIVSVIVILARIVLVIELIRVRSM